MTVVGLDLGGTKIAAAVVDRDGAVGALRQVPTPAAAGADGVLDAAAALVRDVLRTGPAAGGGEPPAGVGVGTAGVVDVETGRVLSATDSLPGWAGTDVAGGLRERLGGGVPVLVQNDVDAHASGEAWVGAASGETSALLVAVGTGVGGALVLGGRVWRGARGVAGEIGHVPVPGAEGLRCACGRQGHLEAIGAGPGLHRYFLTLGGDPSCGDARAVVALAGTGHEVAVRAVRDSAAAVGRAVAGLVTATDPAVVVVAGGLADAGPLWWDALRAAARAELIDVLHEVPLRRAALGATAAVVGAARPVWLLLDGSAPWT